MDNVVIIAGPTASGKSAHALKMAQERRGVIINGDSQQVYRGLEVLTAQPSAADQHAVPHRLYGTLELNQPCSVGHWLAMVFPAISEAIEGGHVPIVVSGTGLYLKALMEGLPQLPKGNLQIRQELEPLETPTLYAELQQIDPALAARLHPNDRQRIIRGVEVWRATGKQLSAWQSTPPVAPPFTFESHLIMPSADESEDRIAHRLDAMFEAGVCDEVAHACQGPLAIAAKQAIGLKEIAAHVRGELSLEDTKALVHVHTRQYAKRQRTWFRHQFKG